MREGERKKEKGRGKREEGRGRVVDNSGGWEFPIQ